MRCPTPLLMAMILFVAAANLWLAFPQLDLAVSGLFIGPEGGFPARGQPWEQLLYGSIGKVLVVIGVALIAAWAVARLRRVQTPRITGRRLLFLLLLLALIPGVLVNLVLKEHWGRARPVQLETFGGSRAFTPAFVISNQGGSSFPSGHVAAATWVVAVAIALFGPWSILTLMAWLYLLAMALARIAAGGHFISDATTAALLVWIGYLVLKPLLLDNRSANAQRGRETA
jgi:lipid A 4'-phosphatase